jgi:hypothetical protein
MTAAQITPSVFPMMGTQFLLVKMQKVTASDWICLGNGTYANKHVKGVIMLAGIGTSTAASLNETVPTYGVATINNKGTAYSATDTSIVVDTATITRVAPYYISTAGGEILEVTADSAVGSSAGTLTVRRGALGTTASATGLADDNIVSIMNIIFLAANCVGPEYLVLFPLPNDAGTKPFA